MSIILASREQVMPYVVKSDRPASLMLVGHFVTDFMPRSATDFEANDIQMLCQCKQVEKRKVSKSKLYYHPELNWRTLIYVSVGVWREGKNSSIMPKPKLKG